MVRRFHESYRSDLMPSEEVGSMASSPVTHLVGHTAGQSALCAGITPALSDLFVRCAMHSTSVGYRRGDLSGFFDLYSDLRRPIDGQVSAVFLLDETGVNSPNPEGWRAWLA